MKIFGKISVGQLLIGLALAAGAVLAGLLLLLPEDVRIRFVLSKNGNEWTVTRIEAQP